MEIRDEAVDRAVEANRSLPENECQCLGGGIVCDLCRRRMAMVLKAAMEPEATVSWKCCGDEPRTYDPDRYGLVPLKGLI